VRVEWLELVNYCQFQSRRFEFPAGLVAIVGPNGSGKSNLLGAIRWLLTGTNPNPGKAAENISQFATAAEKSYVRACFSHAGTRAIVTRNIRPATPAAVLEEEGRAVVVGTDKVDARVCEILQTDTRVMNDIVIVAQDDIFGFLAQTPGKRAEQFQKLFRTEAASALSKVLEKQLAAVAATQPYSAVDQANCEEVIRVATAEIATITASLATMPSFDACYAGIQTNQNVQAQWDQVSRLRGWLNDRTTKVEPTKATIATLVAATAQSAAGVQQLTVAIDELREQRAAAETAAKLQSLYDQYVATRQRLEAALAAAEAAEQRLVVPVQPTGYPFTEERQRLQSLRAAHTAKIQEATAIETALAQATVRCPTCRVPSSPRLRITEAVATLVQQQALAADAAAVVDTALAGIRDGVDTQELTARKDAVLQEARELAGQVATLAAIEPAQARYEQALTAYQRNLETARSQKAAVQMQLTGLSPVQPPPGIDAQAILTKARALEAELKAAQSTHARQDRDLATQQQTLASLEGEIAQYTQSLAQYPPTLEQDAAAAGQRIAAWRDWVTRRQQTEASLVAEQLAVKTAQSRLEAITKAIASSAVDQAWSQRLQMMAGLVHHSAAPRFVAQENLKLLERYVNENLGLFDAEFRVHADEGLSFVASFRDGVRRQPAERLSGGQKVVLALAFRLATNLQLATGVGALYLDEPTAYLDHTHLKGFAPALERLRAFSAAAGLQCVIVTHEATLAPLFDTAINLGNTSA
jgi:DNA repair exonuclease SbcCD ATPase subunit